MSADLANLDLATFEPLIDAAFDVPLGAEPFALTLREAAATGAGVRAGGAFSLLFEGPRDRPLAQGVYELARPDLNIGLFLVPIGAFRDGLGYEAVFA